MGSTNNVWVPQPTRFVNHFIMNHMDQDLRPLPDALTSQRALPIDNLAEAEGRFNEAMYQYHVLLELPASHAANLMSNCSGWEELEALVQQAENQYARNPGLVQRAARWAGDRAPCLQLWAGLLPPYNNLAILAGGAKLLLSVAEKRSLQRQRMLEALHRLTDVVSKSEESLKRFSSNDPLRLAAVSLYVALLRMIEACINSLVNEKTWKKLQHGRVGVGEARITVQRYSPQTVEEICNACDEKQREFDWQVEQLTKEKILKTASEVENIATHLTRLQPTVFQTANTSTEVLQAAQDAQERGRRTEAEIKIMRTNVENHGDVLESHGDILVNIRSLLQDIVANSQWHRDAEEANSQSPVSRIQNYVDGMRSLTPAESMTEEQRMSFLWQKIELNPEGCADDLQPMLRGEHTTGDAPAQVLQMLRRPRVKAFIVDATSDAIFVELPIADQAKARRTPLSLGCAMLLHDISRSPHAETLYYFCGLHNRSQDQLCGGIGIARMFIGQLLALPQYYDLSFLDARWRGALEQRHRDALFALLGELILQVKASTLFCFIDGASLFESQDQKDDIKALIAVLLRIAVECQHACHVKLLVTSPKMSRELGPMFEEQGLRGLVKLRDDQHNTVSMNALRVEIARYGPNHSPSPGRRPSERSRYEGD